MCSLPDHDITLLVLDVVRQVGQLTDGRVQTVVVPVVEIYVDHSVHVKRDIFGINRRPFVGEAEGVLPVPVSLDGDISMGGVCQFFHHVARLVQYLFFFCSS